MGGRDACTLASYIDAFYFSENSVKKNQNFGEKGVSLANTFSTKRQRSGWARPLLPLVLALLQDLDTNAKGTTILKMYSFSRSKGLMIITVVYEFIIRKITKVVCRVNTISNHDYFIMQLCNAEAWYMKQ